MKRSSRPLATTVPTVIVAVRTEVEPDPAAGKAKGKFNAARLSDDELVMACNAQLEATRDDPLFDTLQPGEEDFEAQITRFRGSVSRIALLKGELASAYLQRDIEREALETGVRSRLGGVQMLSRGNSAIITRAGFATRRSRTPTGILDAPQGLVVSVGDVPGTLVATWDSVKKNRSYALQYAIGDRATTTDADWTTVFSSKPKSILKGLTPGTTYLFRVTTIGGKDGQSAWSPIVTRMAA